ncbi:MAG: TetR/AcrR family transcriptional regulator [Gammaproteobacteria bacterium]|nr:TetR/AcrR family transcriptional regulator [Gammaproteobacteria bacterium]
MTKQREAPAEPVQERSRKTMNDILDAAEALLTKSSIDRVGIAEIAAKAGVAAGSFYTRFVDKEDLLARLFERYVEDLHRTKDEVVPQLEQEERLERRLEIVIEAVTNLFTNRRGVVRSVIMKIRHDPDYQNPEMMQEFLGFYDLAGQLLVGDGREVRAKNPAAAGRFCMQLIASFSRDAILFEEFPVQMASPSKDPAFKVALKQACLGVLRGV